MLLVTTRRLKNMCFVGIPDYPVVNWHSWLENSPFSIGNTSSIRVHFPLLLLMEEILHHRAYIKPCKWWDLYHINWCRILSINSMLVYRRVNVWFATIRKGNFLRASVSGDQVLRSHWRLLVGDRICSRRRWIHWIGWQNISWDPQGVSEWDAYIYVYIYICITVLLVHVDIYIYYKMYLYVFFSKAS